MTGSTRRISLAILAAVVAASTQAQAHSSSCTPAHLTSALKQVEAECGSAKVISAHRPGARIRGTGHVSQHSFCDGQRGAIDAVFSNRACALSALRKTGYTIITYGRSSHIHIGTDGWRNGAANTNVARRNGANTHVAHRDTANTRVASRQRAAARYASRGRTGVRTASAQWSGEQNGWNDASWSDASWSNGGAQTSARRTGARSASRGLARVRAADAQWSGGQNGWNNANWSDGGGVDSAYAQRSGARAASRQRGVRVASRQASRHQNGWSDANWSSAW